MSKTNTLNVNRIDVIEALITEPLRAGRWVENDDMNVIGDCHVCAVGAYLRQQRKTNRQIDRLGHGLGSDVSYYGDIHAALETHLYLQALSIYFERLVRSMPNARESRLMIKNGARFRPVKEEEFSAAGIDTSEHPYSVQRPITLEDRARLVRFVLRQFPEEFTAEYRVD